MFKVVYILPSVIARYGDLCYVGFFVFTLQVV